MKLATAGRAVLLWFAILLLAIGNGAIREAALVQALGRTMALFVSGVALCAVVLLVSRLSIRWLRPRSGHEAWRIGALWVGLTIGFESGFGALVQHKSGPEMLQAYLLRDGNIWPVVLVVTLAAPRVWYARTRGRERGALGA